MDTGVPIVTLENKAYEVMDYEEAIYEKITD